MKNGPVDTVEDGEGGTSWESGIDVYELPCVKWIASRKLLCSKASNNRFEKDPYFAPKEEKGGLLKETKKC